MKRIVVFLIFMCSFATLSAQLHNPLVPKTATIGATVIAPFLVYPINTTTPVVENVIAGQNRTNVQPTSGVRFHKLFGMSKETNKEVQLWVKVLNLTQGNVSIKVRWYFGDNEPPSGDAYYGPLGNPINGNVKWYEQATIGWIGVVIDEINATNALVPGNVTFTAEVKGKYTHL